MKRNIIVIGMLLLFLALNIFAVEASAKADFSGTWVMDKTRSEMPPDMEQTMTITQAGNTINIETKIVTGQNERTNIVSYILNSKEIEYKANRGNIEVNGKRTAHWSVDGNGFEVKEEETFDTPSGTSVYYVEREWVMAPDGKTVTIQVTAKGAISQKFKRTFVKK